MADYGAVKLWGFGERWLPAHAESNDYRESGRHKHTNIRHCEILNLS